MAPTEHKWDIELTTDTPYLALTGEIWGVCCEHLGENWPRYNGMALYFSISPRMVKPCLALQCDSELETQLLRMFAWGFVNTGWDIRALGCL